MALADDRKPIVGDLTRARIETTFKEWDRRATDEKWRKNPFDSKASANIFIDIANNVLPDGSFHPEY